MKAMRVLLCTVLAVGLTGAARAATSKNIFVSTDATWKPAGMEKDTGTTYTDLATAVNKARKGYTVWIQDGFVCDSGSTKMGTSSGLVRIKCPNYDSITIRSESGYVDEANGKGAYIRGAKDSSSTEPDGRGDNAIRPFWSRKEATTFVGLVLEEGATGTDESWGSGGAVYGGCIISNCLIRNLAAYSGGAVSCNNGAVTVYNTVISNCSSFGEGQYGGGGAVYGTANLFDCEVVDCSSAKKPGGVTVCSNEEGARVPQYSRCVFRRNSAPGGFAFAFTKHYTRALFEDCIFDSNSTGCIYGVMDVRRCSFVNNTGTPIQGAETITRDGVQYTSWEPGRAWIADCAFTNNTEGAYGGAMTWAAATNCTIIANQTSADGGGAQKSILCNCEIAGNKAVSSDVTTGGNGGGAAYCDLYNCCVTNNRSSYRGAAVYNPDRKTGAYRCYNCLFAGNVSEGNVSEGAASNYNRGMIVEGEEKNTLATNPTELYNCTIAGNVTPVGAVINDAKLYNCIVWGNTAPSGEFYTGQVWAEYTCQKDLTEGEDHNINQNPNLTADYHLASPQPCSNVAYQYDWMTNRVDVRSRDADRRLRILGPSPDLGCYERDDPGLFIIVR